MSGTARIASPCKSRDSVLVLREVCNRVLDVVFGEDASRLRNGTAAENYSVLRKFVLSLLSQAN